MFVSLMNILLIGNGGREHALAWKIKQSNLTDKLYIAPGNAGTALVGENISIGVNDFKEISKSCLEKNISLVVVGPEVPLVGFLRESAAILIPTATTPPALSRSKTRTKSTKRRPRW